MSILYVFMLTAILSAAMILVTRNILYCAYLLAICLLSIGAMYVFAGNTFLAVSQILVYVGGVVVLIVFGVMVTTRGEKGVLESKLRGPIKGVAAGLVVLLMLGTIFMDRFGNIEMQSDVPISSIGVQIMTNYLLAFEAIAVLLLIAIIGAAVIARSEIRNNNG